MNFYIFNLDPVSQVCAPEVYLGISWTRSSGGSVNLQPCPGEQTGEITTCVPLRMIRHILRCDNPFEKV